MNHLNYPPYRDPRMGGTGKTATAHYITMEILNKLREEPSSLALDINENPGTLGGAPASRECTVHAVATKALFASDGERPAPLPRTTLPQEEA